MRKKIIIAFAALIAFAYYKKSTEKVRAVEIEAETKASKAQAKAAKEEAEKKLTHTPYKSKITGNTEWIINSRANYISSLTAVIARAAKGTHSRAKDIDAGNKASILKNLKTTELEYAALMLKEQLNGMDKSKYEDKPSKRLKSENWYSRKNWVGAEMDALISALINIDY